MARDAGHDDPFPKPVGMVSPPVNGRFPATEAAIRCPNGARSACSANYPITSTRPDELIDVRGRRMVEETLLHAKTIYAIEWKSGPKWVRAETTGKVGRSAALIEVDRVVKCIAATTRATKGIFSSADHACRGHVAPTAG